LPIRAARLWHIHRRKAQDRAREEAIRKRPFTVGANQDVDYWSERECNDVADKYTLPKFPAINGHTWLKDAAKQLKRSTIRIREVAREKGQDLPLFPGKDIKGRMTKRTYVRNAFIPTLAAYFADAKRLQLEGLRKHWGRGRPETPAPKRRGGRPRSRNTAKVYEFCHKLKLEGKKDSVIMSKANAHFGRVVVRDVKHVWLFAKRHADRQESARPGAN
jgi:hypothetical protein